MIKQGLISSVRKYPGILLMNILVIFSVSSFSQVSASSIADCDPEFVPDLPVLPSDDQIDSEIDEVLEKYMDQFLGTLAPSSSDLENAISKYSSLDISVIEGVISGNTVKNDYKAVNFLKTFVNHLRYHPEDTVIRQKANNVVWLVTDQICTGKISVEGASSLYSFDNFARAAAILSRFFNDTISTLFDNAMDAYGALEHFWEPVYDFAYQAQNESINTDIMYNLGDALMAFCANRRTADERYLWMRGYTRWVERFASYSAGTANGIKPDGTGFHHWTAYDNYMYAFKTASKVIYYLSNSSFQISRESYLRFRDAVYAQIIFANEKQVKPLSMSGRKPNERDSQYSDETLKMLAIAGGHILEIPTADTILAAEYNRLFGVSPALNYASVADVSQSSGFFQFNYANLGIYRKEGWLACMKGFTYGLWGAELYPTANRYGRYQSYGTLEIVYPGDLYFGNGFNVASWNWNYNPGATTIVLPWSKLQGEYARIDEYQAKGFAGALAFDNKNSKVLQHIHGNVGLFAMDFNETEGQGFSTKYGPNTHNNTFRWKKSVWTFADMIIALGSDINNDDGVNPTVTTLFQRVENNDNGVIINGNLQDQPSIFPGDGNWIISNYSTGFYIHPGNDDTEIWNGEQQVPFHDQIDPSLYVDNPKIPYWRGFINHGTNPENADYEYMVIPNATRASMEELDQKFKSGQKPYAIYQKNGDGHIVRHHTGSVGYAIFNAQVDYEFPGLLNQVNRACLIMYQPNETNTAIRISITTPDMGIQKRSYQPALQRSISFTLDSVFSLPGNNNPVPDQIEVVDGKTMISLTVRDGMPVELVLNGAVPEYTPTGIKHSRKNSLLLYPNPTKNRIWIEGDIPVNSSWKIYNLQGLCLLKGQMQFKNQALDISSLAPGAYLIQVTDQRDFYFTGKLLVQQ